MKRISDSIGFALLLNLILPGAGHIYRREYLFGTFVFLVMLMASVLLFFVLLVTLPDAVLLVLFGLPALFYLFSYVDLWRSVRRQEITRPRGTGSAVIFLVVALAVNVLAPLSPINLLLRNAPELVTATEQDRGSSVASGAIAWVDRAAYRVNLFFLDQPMPRAYPDRWHPVRFRAGAEGDRIGLVVGLPGEEVTVINDSLFVDGFPEPGPSDSPVRLKGELPLTLVDSDLIMVVTLSDGDVEGVYQIPTRDIIGKVHCLF